MQLAKIMGVKRVIALASSKAKLDLVRSLGADVVINYGEPGWVDQVRQATAGRGVDVVLEMASGQIGDESFKLIAPFGRVVLFGARNYHDLISTEKIQQLIFKNQSIIGFALATLRPEQISECVPALLQLILAKRIKLFANNSFPLVQVKSAFEALSGRHTIGKIVLIPLPRQGSRLVGVLVFRIIPIALRINCHKFQTCFVLSGENIDKTRVIRWAPTEP